MKIAQEVLAKISSLSLSQNTRMETRKINPTICKQIEITYALKVTLKNLHYF